MGPTKRRLSDKLARDIGAAIREARDAANLSQDELAHRAEINRAYMGNIEQGKYNVTVRKLRQVCAALGLKPSQLLSRIGL